MRRGCAVLCGLALLVTAVWMPAAWASGGSAVPGVADANPPEGTIRYPDPGDWIGQPYVYLSVTFTDPDGISRSSLSMSVDGMSLTTSWTNFVLSAVAQGLAEGPHTAEARASDELGNGPTVLTWSFSLDTTPPEVDITSPAGNPELPDGSVTLTWTGTDAGSGIDRYEVRLDSGPAIDAGNVTTFRFHALAPGIHYFDVRAYDDAGNYNYPSTMAVATVPLEPPSPPSPLNTTVNVSLPSDVPSWAVALIALSAVELVAIAGLGLRTLRGPRGGTRPSE